MPFYNGDNGGATYQGVTGKEVRVLIYFDPYGTLNTSQGASTPPYNTIIDTDKPAKPNEHPAVDTSAAGRSSSTTATPPTTATCTSSCSSAPTTRAADPAGSQAQDAALAYAKVKPFAVVNYSSFGNGAFYNNYMAEHGVLNFGSVAGRSAKFYKQFPGKQWGYTPPIEYSAAQYANFVCTASRASPRATRRRSTGIANGPRASTGCSTRPTRPSRGWPTRPSSPQS